MVMFNLNITLFFIIIVDKFSYGTPKERMDLKKWLESHIDDFVKATGYSKDGERCYFELTKLFKTVPALWEKFDTIIVLGSRNMGKTESMRRMAKELLDKGEKFIWLRDTDKAMKAVLDTERVQFDYKDNFISKSGIMFRSPEDYDNYKYRYAQIQQGLDRMTKQEAEIKATVSNRAESSVLDGIYGWYYGLSTLQNLRSNEKPASAIFFDEFIESNISGNDYLSLSRFAITNLRSKPNMKIIAVSNMGDKLQTNTILRNLGYPMEKPTLLHIDFVTSSIVITLPGDAYNDFAENEVSKQERLALGSAEAYNSQFGDADTNMTPVNHLIYSRPEYRVQIDAEHRKMIIPTMQFHFKDSDSIKNHKILFCSDANNLNDKKHSYLALDGDQYSYADDKINTLYYVSNGIVFHNFTDDKQIAYDNGYRLIHESTLIQLRKAILSNKILFQDIRIKNLFLGFIERSTNTIRMNKDISLKLRSI